MADEEKDESKLGQCILDVKKRMASLKTADVNQENVVDFVKRELQLQLYPFLEAIAHAAQVDLREEVDSLAEDVDNIDSQVGMLIGRTADIIHPQTAEVIHSALEKARDLAQELEKLAASADDVTKKRIAEKLIAARAGFDAAVSLVEDLTIEPESESELPANEGDPK